MIELLGSKASVNTGKKVYGTAFGEPSNLAHRVEDISDMLVEQGFCYNGKDFLTSGITGAAGGPLASTCKCKCKPLCSWLCDFDDASRDDASRDDAPVEVDIEAPVMMLAPVMRLQ
eukprot:1160442-Pelagomonas_calceolata.AAC.17